MRQIIESTQKERQREVWGLIVQKIVPKQVEEAPKLEVPGKKETPTPNGNFSPFHIPKTVNHDPVSPLDENMLRVNFRVAGPVSMPLTMTPHSLQLQAATDVEDVIQCNNEWRYR